MSTDIREIDRNNVLPHYVNLRKRGEEGADVVVSGDRVYVTDSSGRRFLDASSCMWAASLGFSEYRPVDAAIAQFRKLPFYHYGLNKTHEPAAMLAQKLAQMVPMENPRIHFATTGSEANDFLIKFLWFMNNARDMPQKTKVISHVNAWHGATIAAGSMSGIPRCHEGYNLPLPGFIHIPAPHYFRNAKDGESEEQFVARLCDNLRAVIAREGGDTIAAMIVEPVGGASGVVVPPKDYFPAVQEILAEHDILMIADEVITGFGRTGRMFGSELMNIKPDAMTFAKGFSGALMPISAMAISNAIYEGLVAGSDRYQFFAHGSTFAGHPASCAAALATIDIVENDDLTGNALAMGEELAAGFEKYRDHPLVGEIRGCGLMWAMELVADRETRRLLKPTGAAAHHLALECEKRDLIIRNLANGDSIAIAPPLIINAEEVADIFARFDDAFDATIAWIDANGLAKG